MLWRFFFTHTHTHTHSHTVHTLLTAVQKFGICVMFLKKSLLLIKAEFI